MQVHFTETPSQHDTCDGFWALAGADKPPHGAPGQPSTLAAILRHPDLSGKLSLFDAVAASKQILLHMQSAFYG